MKQLQVVRFFLIRPTERALYFQDPSTFFSFRFGRFDFFSPDFAFRFLAAFCFRRGKNFLSFLRHLFFFFLFNSSSSCRNASSVWLCGPKKTFDELIRLQFCWRRLFRKRDFHIRLSPATGNRIMSLQESKRENFHCLSFFLLSPQDLMSFLPSRVL